MLRKQTNKQTHSDSQTYAFSSCCSLPGDLILESKILIFDFILAYVATNQIELNDCWLKAKENNTKITQMSSVLVWLFLPWNCTFVFESEILFYLEIIIGLIMLPLLEQDLHEIAGNFELRSARSG